MVPSANSTTWKTRLRPNQEYSSEAYQWNITDIPSSATL